MTAIMPTTNLRPLPLNPARFALPALLVALVATATALQPSFLSGGNLQNILTQASPLLIVTMGQAVVMLVRGLDLSVASLMATMAVVATAFNASDDFAIPMIFAIVVVLSAIVGLANGLLVTRRKVSPFIATLAMMIVLQGLRFAYTKGAPAGSLPQGFRYLGAGRLWGFPVNLILFALLFAIFWVVLSKTSLGRRIYIVGGNPRAAELVGLNSDRITIVGYVLCSVLAGLGGLLLVGYVGTVDNWVGRGYELDFDHRRGHGRRVAGGRSRRHCWGDSRRIDPHLDLQHRRHSWTSGPGPAHHQRRHHCVGLGSVRQKPATLDMIEGIKIAAKRVEG